METNMLFACVSQSNKPTKTLIFADFLCRSKLQSRTACLPACYIFGKTAPRLGSRLGWGYQYCTINATYNSMSEAVATLTP